MCSTRGSRALPREGCATHKSPDQRSLPTPRCLSQVAASFFGSWCLGIHLGPLLACSTYNHSSVAEEMATRSRQKRKRIQILLYGILEISLDLFGCQCAGGDERARTADPLLAKQVLSQLSYIPWDTAKRNRAYSGANRASLRMRSAFVSAGGCQTLKSEEWERQEQKTGLFADALERTKRDGFAPRAEPPTVSFS